MTKNVDVAILGGGKAGLSLALQIKRKLPQLTVLVLERHIGPLPDACHKVGESMTEIASTYFERELDMREHLCKRQLRKFGLRYFFGEGETPFEERTEIGLRVLPPFATYQLDRGRFESELRQRARAAGCELLEGTDVSGVEFGRDGGNHLVSYKTLDGEAHQSACRWVIDASGRRRIIQRSLGLALDSGHRGSAAWFRVKGIVSVADLVDKQNSQWHNRILADRCLSTTHLLGKGYWIWLITLASDYTSIGVVIDPRIHQDCEIGPDFNALLPWLRRHQPRFADYLDKRTICDFKAMRDYSYTSKQVFSSNRWACVGEAATFLDPLYSPGGDAIAIGNTMTLDLICRDLGGQLTDDIVAAYNRLFLDGFYRASLPIFKTYSAFGAPSVFLTKHLWDSVIFWGINCQIYFQKLLIQPEWLSQVQDILERVAILEERVQTVFADWAALAEAKQVDTRLPAYSFERGYADPALAPYLQLLVLDLNVKKSPARAISDMKINLARYEEAAQLIFFAAVKDVLPEKLETFASRWVDPYSMILNPALWGEGGPCSAKSRKRDLTPIAQSMFGGVLVPLNWASWCRRCFTRWYMQRGNGQLFYRTLPPIRTALAKGWLPLYRWLFVRDQPIQQL